MFSRKQVAVLGAEFFGTAVLALVMLSVQHTLGYAYFVALAAGITLAALSVVFSGNGVGHFNPAITFAMWTVRQMRAVRMIAYIVAQLLGALAAYWLYIYFIKAPNLQPIPGVAWDPRIMAAEAVGAFVLSLAYAAAVFNGYMVTRRAAVVGATYALAIILTASATIGVINPAVALSMRAVDLPWMSFTGWGTYILGPMLGAVIGFNLYALLFAEESALLRLGGTFGQRLSGRSRTASASAAAAAPAAAPRRAGRASTAKRTTRRSSSRRPRSTTRSRRS